MNFDKAFELTIGIEGAFTDDPNDNGNWTGGKRDVGMLMGTKYGIAANTYGEALLDMGKTIKNLTLEDAKNIYWTDWWSPMKCDYLPEKYRYPLFSAAINCGMTKAIKWLQLSVGTPSDGIIGPKTISAAIESGDEGLEWFYKNWKNHYHNVVKKNPKQCRFLKGWENRISHVRETNV